MQRDLYIHLRTKFVQLAIKDNKQAAERLRDLATGLENCRNVSDTVNALCTIFAISERTVFNDLKR